MPEQVDVRLPMQPLYMTNPRGSNFLLPPKAQAPSQAVAMAPPFRASRAQTTKNQFVKKGMFSFQAAKEHQEVDAAQDKQRAGKMPPSAPQSSQIGSTMAQTMTASTRQQNTQSHQHISNWTNFNEQYNDLGLNTHLETYSYKQELIKIAQKNYQEQDVKKLFERIQDLETTLQINKTLVQDSMTALSVAHGKGKKVAAQGTPENSEGKDGEQTADDDGQALLQQNLEGIFRKFADENDYIKKRLQLQYQENEQLRSKMLLLEQINADFKMKEHKITIGFEE